MKRSKTWLMFCIALAIPAMPCFAGSILGTSGRVCYPTTFTSGSLSSDISVFGDWIETIDKASASGSGISVTIVQKLNGAQHNTAPFSGRGMVTLTIVTNNASPGAKSVTLSGGLFGSASFTINVFAPTTVTSSNIPTPADPFQDITFTLNGTGLQEASDPASGQIIQDNLTPLVTVGSPVSVSGVRVLSSSSTSLQAKVFFTGLVQDATVELHLRSFNSCVPLGDPKEFKTRVHVKSTNVKNYVSSITFPNGSTFDVNSVATVHINLLFPAPGALLSSGSGTSLVTPVKSFGGPTPQIPSQITAALAASTALRNENSIVFFQLVPRDAFEAVQGGTVLNANGLTQVAASAGDNIIPLTFKVKNCLGGQPGQVNVVKIQTWMHNTNSTLPPNFVEQQFGVRCIQ